MPDPAARPGVLAIAYRCYTVTFNSYSLTVHPVLWLHTLQVHPAKLTSALVAAACAKGAQVVTGTVTGITTQPQGQQRLVTGEGGVQGTPAVRLFN
jgi:hypothetical protein